MEWPRRQRRFRNRCRLKSGPDVGSSQLFSAARDASSLTMAEVGDTIAADTPARADGPWRYPEGGSLCRGGMVIDTAKRAPGACLARSPNHFSPPSLSAALASLKTPVKEAIISAGE